MNIRTLTIPEVMARTGLKRCAVYALIQSGDVTFTKGPSKNSTIRVFEESLEQCMTARARGARRAIEAKQTGAPSFIDGDDLLPAIEHPVFS